MVTKFKQIATNEEEKSETYDIELNNKNTYKVTLLFGENSVKKVLNFIVNTKKKVIDIRDLYR